ncbi:MAG: acyl-CoA thioesterase [Gammaproteobacteria bacterium]
MFKQTFEVRDNEIDAQGVVNNANYFIYMAHTRHKFLHSIGVNFDDYAKNNQNLFLLSTQINFKKALVANDNFYVTCEIVREGKLKIAFEQEVIRSSDEQLMAHARNIGVCVDGNNRNRPYIPEAFERVFCASE